MIAHGALRPRIGGFFKDLGAFFRANKAQLVCSGTYAASEIYAGNYPYLIVPMLFGLGAPPIILDTTFKVFRGGATIFGAVCDILVPRQTSALAERDSAHAGARDACRGRAVSNTLSQVHEKRRRRRRRMNCCAEGAPGESSFGSCVASVFVHGAVAVND